MLDILSSLMVKLNTDEGENVDNMFKLPIRCNGSDAGQ